MSIFKKKETPQVPNNARELAKVIAENMLLKQKLEEATTLEAARKVQSTADHQKFMSKVEIEAAHTERRINAYGKNEQDAEDRAAEFNKNHSHPTVIP